jgi:CubicO group peptidase (beta-lactamase class C family)
MKNCLSIIFFSLILSFPSQAKHQNEPYEPHNWDKFKVIGSENYYKFETDLIEDKDVKKEIKNTKKTGLISYLLFEDNKIKIDEESLPNYIKSNNGVMPSHSVGKSLVSYVLGHAICEGYIDNINITLDDWSALNGTLYKGQKLIDILNMRAGDQKFIGERKFNSDNKIQDVRFLNVNTFPIKDAMELEILQKTKKSGPVYNYNALATNLLMNYTIYKTGDDWEKLLHKVFNEHVRIKDSVWFHQTVKMHNKDIHPRETGRYSFYASRYDYLRIGKRILDDWNNNTCVGKYLKTIYDQRINKNRKGHNTQSASQYSKKYGGQFHFDIIGLSKKKILAMDGFGGQQLIVDFDSGRIIVIHSLDRHYNWKKIVHKKLKQK